jgi:hypothetical protein
VWQVLLIKVSPRYIKMNTLFSARNIGLLTAAIMMAVTLVCFYVLKMPFNSKFQYVVYAIYTAGIVWVMYNYKKKAAATATFKMYFSEGFRIFMVVTFIMVVFSFIFFTANPQIRDTMIAENNALLLQQGDHTPPEIAENAIKMKRIFMPMTLGATTFKFLILGVMVTAVSAIMFIKKEQAK